MATSNPHRVIVVKHGSPPPPCVLEFMKEAECQRCGCIFKYFPQDTMAFTTHVEPYMGIYCPEKGCNSPVRTGKCTKLKLK